MKGGDLISYDYYIMELTLYSFFFLTAKSSAVAFYAESDEIDNNYVLNGNHGTLVLNKLLVQTGNDYNTATGKFVAPEIGYYVFTYTVVITKTSIYSLSIQLITGNQKYAESSANVADNAEAKTLTGTAVVLLSKGEEFSLDFHNSGAEVRIHACWFAGWLQTKT